MTTEFPLDPAITYLNHAAVAPWPRRTADAVSRFADENLHRGATDYPRWMEAEAGLREQLRWLINAPSVDDIALLKNTSEGLSVLAHGLDWRAGDNVVIPAQEFPSNRIVWESLARFGVEVRAVDVDAAGDPESALMERVDARTRLMSVSAVQYARGLRMRLEPLGAFCRERGILFCVDAIQQLGALPFDAQQVHADCVVADGHKWMLGPEGLALFYTTPALRERLTLHQFGWHMVEQVGDFDRRDWVPAGSARRFECGSPNTVGVYALSASLSLLQETGLHEISLNIVKNTQYLIDKIIELDELELLTVNSPERLSGIVTFRRRDVDAAALYRYLMDTGVICAHRGGGIRFSPHFYQGRDELDRGLDAVRNYR
jgi:selenocysteine lyase/cysteine desulfurase